MRAECAEDSSVHSPAEQPLLQDKPTRPKVPSGRGATSLTRPEDSISARLRPVPVQVKLVEPGHHSGIGVTVLRSESRFGLCRSNAETTRHHGTVVSGIVRPFASKTVPGTPLIDREC
uniref:Uncharacterized protein n=1 Tax=Anopheles merus TaxID=30066 RepID=A0A182V1E1_ANOME